MHLLELAAIAIHDMAGDLFARFHPNGEPEGSTPMSPQFKNMVSLSTMLYCIPSLFPRGPFDAVGYWTEVQVFGGVVVFDRGPQEGARHVSTIYRGLLNYRMSN